MNTHLQNLERALLPDELVRHVWERNCVLVLGADAAVALSVRPPILAEFLAQSLLGRVLENSFQACQEFELKAELHRASLIQAIREYHQRYGAIALPLYEVLSSLWFPYIITVGQHPYLEKTLARKEVDFVSICTSEDIANSIQEDRIRLVHLFGTIDPEKRPILTERDLIDLPETAPNIYDLAVAALARHNVLMVAVDLSDKYFRSLYKDIANRIGGRAHKGFALSPVATSDDMEYWADNAITTICGNPERLLRQLQVRQSGLKPRVTTNRIESRPKEPYKYLDYYEEGDEGVFFGRREDTLRLLHKILSHRLTVVCGRSGVGKTSLLRAGVAPRMNNSPGYRMIYLRCGEDPTAAAVHAISEELHVQSGTELTTGSLYEQLSGIAQNHDGELVIVFDQFEEFFVALGEEVQKHFLNEVDRCLSATSLPARFVLCLRAGLWRFLQIRVMG